MTPKYRIDPYGHQWATPYRGVSSCAKCGIPETNSKASVTCLNADAQLATDEEAREAGARMVTRHRKALER